MKAKQLRLIDGMEETKETEETEQAPPIPLLSLFSPVPSPSNAPFTLRKAEVILEPLLSRAPARGFGSQAACV
jgi:hypothetical protein